MPTSPAALRDEMTPHGLVISRRLLRERGWTHKDVAKELRAGRWATHGLQTVALHNGPLSWEAEVARAVWETGVGVAALDGATALRVGGMTGYTDEDIHVSVPHTSRVVAPAGVRLHKVGRRPATDLLAGTVPRAKPLPAALRAAHWAVSDRQAALLLVMPVQQRLVRPEDLRAAARRPPGRTRRRFLGDTASAICGGAQSLGELDFAAVCRRHGVPEPSRQQVRQAAGRRYVLDASWDEAGFAVEVDGSGHRDRLTVSLDHLRTNDVVAGGERILRVDLLGLRLFEARFMAQVTRMLESSPVRSR